MLTSLTMNTCGLMIYEQQVCQKVSQEAAQQVEEQIWEQVWHQIYDPVSVHVWDQTDRFIVDQIEASALSV